MCMMFSMCIMIIVVIVDIMVITWLRTNGINTNGVTAKILFLDGIEQVLTIHVWDMTEFRMSNLLSSP